MQIPQLQQMQQALLLPQTAAIYFCFLDDKYDEVHHPNKLVLARAIPTVADLCSTLKALFYTGQEVTLTACFVQDGDMGGVPSEFNEQSPISVPVNDSTNVVEIKIRYVEGGAKLNHQQLQILHWLQSNNLDIPGM